MKLGTPLYERTSILMDMNETTAEYGGADIDGGAVIDGGADIDGSQWI